MRWPSAFCPGCRGRNFRLPLLLRGVLLATLLLGLGVVQAEPAPPAKRILLLHAWAQGNPWPESINRGVRQGLAAAAQPVELYIENADTTRFSTRDYAALAEFIAHKYALQPPDLLLAADEQSLAFISRYRAQLFADKPLVFASFPERDQAQLARLGNAYQVLDSQDVAGNFQLIHEFLPKTQTLVLLGDSATAVAREGLTQAVEQVREQFAEVRDLRATPIGELEKILPNLPADSAVFVSTWIRDEQGLPLDPFVVLPKLVTWPWRHRRQSHQRRVAGPGAGGAGPAVVERRQSGPGAPADGAPSGDVQLPGLATPGLGATALAGRQSCTE